MPETTQYQRPLRPPSRTALLGETRVAWDLVRMVRPLAQAHFSRLKPPRDRLIIVIPGFGSDDRYLAPLRYFLNRNGYQAEGWGLGRNLAGVNMPHTLSDLSDRWRVEPRKSYRGEASVPYLCDRLIERLIERHRASAMPITLIGWSLGGYLAREAARDLPDVVEQLITFGAPTMGGPKYTAAAPFFARRGMDLEWIEAEIAKRNELPIQQPMTLIYSKSDAIVSWGAALDRSSSQVEHIEVNAAHLGMGFNPTIWALVLDALATVAD